MVISGDATGNDTLVTGTFITDVDASLTADPTSLDDNTRVVNFTAGNGNLTLQRVTITGGRLSAASDDGGGIQFLSDGTLLLDQSHVSGNSNAGRRGDGGGVFASPGAVRLTNSTVSGNRTGRSGGGVLAGSGVAVTNSTISGNISGSDGGGIITLGGAVTLTDSTVTGNRGDTYGGIYVPNSLGNPPLTIQNSIVAGNMVVGNPLNGAPDLRPDPEFDARYRLQPDRRYERLGRHQ